MIIEILKIEIFMLFKDEVGLMILMILIEMMMFVILLMIAGEMMRLMVLKFLYIKFLKIGCVGEILDLLRRTPYFILAVKIPPG